MELAKLPPEDDEPVTPEVPSTLGIWIGAMSLPMLLIPEIAAMT